MNIKYTIIGAICAAALFTTSAQAEALEWQFKNVTFADGGTLSGNFVFDTELSRLLSFDVSTTSGSVVQGFHYNAGSSEVWDSSEYQNFYLFDNGYNRMFQVGFANPLNQPGINAISGSECNDWLCSTTGRAITSGVVQAVPEPETYALMLAGLGLVAWAARRKAARK
jgi:PEP-CTERM motif